MLQVKTKIGPSDIQGIGLFADQFIPMGTVVWKFMPGFDLLYTKEQIELLSEAVRDQFYNYSFFDPNHEAYMLCADDGRFFNHSEQPNCDDSGANITIALTDINPGEELTVDYKVFYGDIQDHPEILTNNKPAYGQFNN